MSVNLTKNKNALLEAWKDVVNDESATDWALFSYEKQSNDLYVVEKGDGGLEELIDEMNSGKVMYAFVRVICPNSGLPKFVFINWQGEGAPLTRKGTCANHVVDISNFFKGHHITVNARMEDDVEPSLILEKVSKASASTFNFTDRSDPVEHMTPVGSVYKRVMPQREINSTEREKFWVKEQEAEKKRLSEERKKAEEERRRQEEVRREQESKELNAREKLVREQHQSINRMKEAQRNGEKVNSITERLDWEKQLADDQKEQEERRSRSEHLRRQRSQEAQSLISQRTVNARAVFEQNTFASQMSTTRNSAPNHDDSKAQERQTTPTTEEIVHNLVLQNFTKQQQQQPTPEVLPKSVTSTTTNLVSPTRNFAPDLVSPTRQAMPNLISPVKYSVPDVVSPMREVASDFASPTREVTSDFVSPTRIASDFVSPTRIASDFVSPTRIASHFVSPTKEVASDLVSPTNQVMTDVVSPIKEIQSKPPKQSISALQSEVFRFAMNLIEEPPCTANEKEEEQNWGESTVEVQQRALDPLAELMAEHGIVEPAEEPSMSENIKVLTENNFTDGLRARALYDYQAADDTEISFDPDDIITQIDQIDEGWWQGLGPDGTYGLFPANYVELLE